MAPTIELFEPAGRDGRRYSLFSWRTRLALARCVNFWTDRTLIPALAPNIAAAIPDCVEADDAMHIRAGFERVLDLHAALARAEAPRRAAA